MAVHVELVQRAHQKGLMHHRGEQRIGHAMAGDVDERDAGRLPAAPKVLGSVGSPLTQGARDASFEVEPLLEVDVDDVIAARGAEQRPRAAPDVDARQPRHLTRRRDQIAGDVLKVFELSHQVGERGVVGRVHENSVGWESHHSMTRGPGNWVPCVYTICTTAPSGSFTWNPNSMLSAGVRPCCFSTSVAVFRLKPCTPMAK